jgi:hypothetical protein
MTWYLSAKREARATAALPWTSNTCSVISPALSRICNVVGIIGDTKSFQLRTEIGGVHESNHPSDILGIVIMQGDAALRGLLNVSVQKIDRPPQSQRK